MRIAIISDIHGNLVALKTVLEALAGEQVDQRVFLGDAVAFGPQPRQALAELRALNCPAVMGNTDEAALNFKPVEAETEEMQRFIDLYAWCVDQLSPADFDYLRTFRPTIELPLDGEATLLCVHGSPKSNRDVILATTPGEELEPMLSGCSARVMVGGHTHIQLFRRYGELSLVNPGSVGLPTVMQGERRRRSHWAEYAIIDWQNGRVSVELRRVLLDVKVIMQTELDSGMPHAKWWAKQWVDQGLAI